MNPSSLSENAQVIQAQLQTLIQLQALDNEMQQRRVQIADMQGKVDAERQQVNALQTDISQRKQNLDKLLKDRRAAELNCRDKQEETKKLNSQLYEVKTNEAYNALQTEIQQKKQANSLLEERILEMMIAEDEIKAEIIRAEAALANTEKHLLGLQEQTSQQVQRLGKEIQDLQNQWQQAAQAVKPQYLEQYQRLRDAKGGIALAKIEDDICTGCRLSMRPQAKIELKKYRTLLTCDNCARILYAD